MKPAQSVTADIGPATTRSATSGETAGKAPLVNMKPSEYKVRSSELGSGPIELALEA
jgi:hypothetical protein